MGLSLKNTIIFLTSNSKSPESEFKPEVLGRIDGILEYKSLDSSIMEKLVSRQLELLNERLKGKKVFVSISPKLKEVLKNRGFDERYGARPLHSVFNKLITRELSRKLLEGSIEEGALQLDWENDRVKI